MIYYAQIVVMRSERPNPLIARSSGWCDLT
jgi:hypothetical protein